MDYGEVRNLSDSAALTTASSFVQSISGVLMIHHPLPEPILVPWLQCPPARLPNILDQEVRSKK
jgi:hypothetical protein